MYSFGSIEGNFLQDGSRNSRENEQLKFSFLDKSNLNLLKVIRGEMISPAGFTFGRFIFQIAYIFLKSAFKTSASDSTETDHDLDLLAKEFLLMFLLFLDSIRCLITQ